MQRLSDRTAGFTDSVIRRMTRISDEYGAVNLSQGFPDFDPPQAILDRLAEVARQGPHQYSITWGAQNFREALAEKQKAIALEPDNARFHDSCGITLHKMGRYEEAVAAFKKAIELNPKKAIYYCNLSQTYKKMGLENEAAQTEEEAKQLQDDSSRA